MPLFLLVLVIVIFIYKVYIKNYKKLRNYMFKSEMKKDGNEFYRDIDTQYSPSIVSYLYNQRIEPEKDLIADILNLYAMNIIDMIKKQNETYDIVLNKDKYIELLGKNEILENDKYIINTIILKQEKFVYNKWINTIVETYRNIGLAKNEVKSRAEYDKKLLKFVIWSTIIGVLFILSSLIFDSSITSTLGFVVILTEVIIFITRYTIFDLKQLQEFQDMHLSENGKIELKKWIGLTNFIESYTLLDKRGIEEIVLFEKYIPFAMALNINKRYIDELLKVMDENQITHIWETVEKYGKGNNIFAQLLEIR